MLYLIGGASRAGKTLLATRFLQHAGVPWLSLDVLRMGLARGAPTLGFNPDRDDFDEADRLWPIVREICGNVFEYEKPYCIEGACLRPTHAAELIACLEGRVRACFLGYPRIDAAEKVDLVRQHAGGPNDWLTNEPEAVIRKTIAAGAVRSEKIETQCRDLDLPFFDTGRNFEPALTLAESFFSKA